MTKLELKTYHRVAEKIKEQVQVWNNLTELYQDYVHLVCRDVITESTETGEFKNGERKSIQLSHPAHSDNCSLKPDGTCVKKEPAYTWRDFSAVLYLNNDFTGGNTFFADGTGRKVQAEVEGKVGRLLGFCASEKCIHGVMPLKSGKRCGLLQWFSQDYREAY